MAGPRRWAAPRVRDIPDYAGVRDEVSDHGRPHKDDKGLFRRCNDWLVGHNRQKVMGQAPKQ